MDSPTRKPLGQDFFIVFGVAQVIGVILVILTIVWLVQYNGGFGWTPSTKEFNFHPLFMLLGFIYVGGNALLVYRLLRNEPKPKLKIVHAVLNGLSLIFAIIGLVAAFGSHNNANPPIPNLYTLHSWIGLGTFILFGLQFVAGLVSFLFPGMPGPLRAIILPYHVYGGTAIFALSVVAVISGLNERAIFKLTAKVYGTLPTEAYIMNFIGVVVVLFALTVGYLVTKAEYKRQPRPEEQQLTMQLEETQQ